MSLFLQPEHPESQHSEIRPCGPRVLPWTTVHEYELSDQLLSMEASRQPLIHTKFGPALFSITLPEMFQFVEPASEYKALAFCPPLDDELGPLSCR